MNIKTIEAILSSHEHVTEYTDRHGVKKSYTDAGWSEWRESASESVTVPDLGVVEVVESEGGGEGDGEHVHLAFRVTADDGSVRFFQKNGFYASFDGTTWDDGEAFFEVKPVEKVVTVFDKVA